MPNSDTHIFTYEGGFKKDFFLKESAPGLVWIFGDTFFLLVERVPFFLTVVSFLSSLIFFDFIEICEGSEWISSLIGLVISVIMIGEIEGYFYGVVDYSRDTKCEKCGEKFAYEEFRKPIIKEVSTPVNYSIEVTRYWRCKYCGHESIRKGSDGFVTKKGELYRAIYLLEKLPCKNCGKTIAYEEYKKPDVKERKCGMDSEIITRRYYRCKYCGYENLDSKV